jgi:protein arginine N-methyltransferase 2
VTPGGVYSFFNGLAGVNYFFHAVYCQIAQLELQQLGLATTFTPLDVHVADAKVWQNVKDRYFTLDKYLLPVCTFSAAAAVADDDAAITADHIESVGSADAAGKVSD